MAMNMNALAGNTVLVLGLGESGLAMARWCARAGATVRVWDTRLAAVAGGIDSTALPNAATLLAEHPAVQLLAGELSGAALVDLYERRRLDKEAHTAAASLSAAAPSTAPLAAPLVTLANVTSWIRRRVEHSDAAADATCAADEAAATAASRTKPKAKPKHATIATIAVAAGSAPESPPRTALAIWSEPSPCAHLPSPRANLPSPRADRPPQPGSGQR
jgi:UDP-N-acetylmuramoylalanine--D-glutamate ligase